MTLDPSDVGFLGGPDSWVIYRWTNAASQNFAHYQTVNRRVL